jgi:hypothetical protein
LRVIDRPGGCTVRIGRVAVGVADIVESTGESGIRGQLLQASLLCGMCQYSLKISRNRTGFGAAVAGTVLSASDTIAKSTRHEISDPCSNPAFLFCLKRALLGAGSRKCLPGCARETVARCVVRAAGERGDRLLVMVCFL